VPYNCVVLIKQVPDTNQVTGRAMNDDGTVNRAALPAIFNPEDLNALELALQIKERFAGSVTVITMGPPSASQILRESLYRGADEAVLVTDRKCAASDTLATSYILSCAVRQFDYDIVLCGRQAIDGDTAQVGPQLAEKLGISQVTYLEELVGIEDRTVTVKRNMGNGYQVVRAKMPLLMTVTGMANEPRPAAAKRMMKFKNARTPAETDDSKRRALEQKGLVIKQWDLDFIGADLNWCGRDGSPTKVHRIQSVVLEAKETKDIEPNKQAVTNMVHELIEDKTIM